MAKRPNQKIELITPDRAEALLAGSDFRNRPIRQYRVDQYATDMAAGRWPYTAAPLILGRNDEVLDGQHRLKAIVKSRCALLMTVLYDAEWTVADAVDRAITRTNGDTLAMRDVPNARIVAATYRLLSSYEAGNFANARLHQISSLEAARMYEERPEVADSVRTTMTTAKSLGVPPSVFAVVHYILARTDQAAADTFFGQVADGVGLRQGNPVLVFRGWLHQEALRRSGGRRTKPEYVLAVTIKAWNAWLEGRSIARLMWRPSSEPFPTLRVPPKPAVAVA